MENEGVGDLNGKTRLSQLNQKTGVTVNTGANATGPVEIKSNIPKGPQLDAATPETPLSQIAQDSVGFVTSRGVAENLLGNNFNTTAWTVDPPLKFLFTQMLFFPFLKLSC